MQIHLAQPKFIGRRRIIIYGSIKEHIPCYVELNLTEQQCKDLREALA